MLLLVGYEQFITSGPGFSRIIALCSATSRPSPEVIKLFIMLNSAEHEIYPAHKC